MGDVDSFLEEQLASVKSGPGPARKMKAGDPDAEGKKAVGENGVRLGHGVSDGQKAPSKDNQTNGDNASGDEESSDDSGSASNDAEEEGNGEAEGGDADEDEEEEEEDRKSRHRSRRDREDRKRSRSRGRSDRDSDKRRRRYAKNVAGKFSLTTVILMVSMVIILVDYRFRRRQTMLSCKEGERVPRNR